MRRRSLPHQRRAFTHCQDDVINRVQVVIELPHKPVELDAVDAIGDSGPCLICHRQHDFNHVTHKFHRFGRTPLARMWVQGREPQPQQNELMRRRSQPAHGAPQDAVPPISIIVMPAMPPNCPIVGESFDLLLGRS